MRAGLVLWPVVVCALTLLVELPASWLFRAIGLPAVGVSGSVWQGRADRLGDAGPLAWNWQVWQREAEVRSGFQGQLWLAQVQGWPWHWSAGIEPLEREGSVATGYRLAGRWHGRLQLEGGWQRCVASRGRLEVTNLALVEPWALGLGQGWLAMRCGEGWRVMGGLELQDQHRIGLEADLLAGRGQVTFAVQENAALTPVLRGILWLGTGASEGQRQFRW